MSRSVKTVIIHQEPSVFNTGKWTEDFQALPVIRDIIHAAQATGLAVMLGVSSLTSVKDPLLEYERSRILLTAQPSRRRISIKEARAISLKILKQAETERRQIADYEADRGIQWSE